jgi:methyltransferase family protein
VSLRRRRRLLVHAAGLFVPHTVVTLARRRGARRLRAQAAALAAAAPQPGNRRFSYDEAVAFLVGRGLDESAVQRGSIGPESLSFIQATIASHFPAGAPIRGLHVGNYVGISLAAFSEALVGVDRRSLTVSVDPNLTHHGATNPQGHVLALLDELGLLGSNVVICGYTFERTPGVTIDSGEVGFEWRSGTACENVLPNLRALGARFDVALVDGCHIGAYARREVELLGELLHPDALLFLDDATPSWEEIQELFADAAEGPLPFERAGYDGRVGVLRRTAA